MYSGQTKGEAYVPRLRVKYPAVVHINKVHDPPLEIEGEITCFSITSLHFCCDSKVPIPSSGTIKFALDNQQSPLEVQIECVSRVELQKSFWSWRSLPKYEIRLSLGQNSRDAEDRYQHFIHRVFFGDKCVPSTEDDTLFV